MSGKPAYDPRTEQLDFVVGDNDVGRVRGNLGPKGGVVADTRLTKNAFAHPQIRYSGRFGEYVIDADLYLMPGTNELLLHIICPVCSTPEHPHALHVSSKRKKIEYDNTRGLYVETFACTWEIPEAMHHRMQFGLSRCKWRVAIEANIAKDA